MIIDEKYLRKIIRSSIIKEIGYGKVSTDVRSSTYEDEELETNTGEEGTYLNFKYVSIPNEKAATKAESEMAFWSGKKESDPAVKQRLKAYWLNIRDIFRQDPEKSIKKQEPWSAAFISYVMNDPFFRSAAHITWKKKADENTKAVSADPTAFAGKETYILLPTDNNNNVKLERGDNVWEPRVGGPNKSHSDVVVSPTEAIGGNVSNTVGKKIINHPFVIKKVKILGPVESSNNQTDGQENPNVA